MKDVMTEREFAAAAYVFLLGLKTKMQAAENDPDSAQAVQVLQDMLAIAPESTRREGRSLFGELAEKNGL